MDGHRSRHVVWRGSNDYLLTSFVYANTFLRVLLGLLEALPLPFLIHQSRVMHLQVQVWY